MHPVARERRREESDIGPQRHPQPQGQIAVRSVVDDERLVSHEVGAQHHR